jgi:hypothetical protein
VAATGVASKVEAVHDALVQKLVAGLKVILCVCIYVYIYLDMCVMYVCIPLIHPSHLTHHHTHTHPKPQIEPTDYPASLEMASFSQAGVKGQVAGAY